ncbi:hypothetical protein B2J93_7419 [Marssonina coronariae]|uniref:Uncharacterized protein n=1 Tax=Diplocarpon coronariae TaxID=2795749 RepID=A0A218Z5N7_9HELO|nr:hypothetical protein B2J93_7419 [Marssonina coronariae]
MAAPWENGCPARMPDSRILKSPVRALNTEEVVASLITDQAAIEVTGQLGGLLSDSVRPFKPDAIIGRPTLGIIAHSTLRRDLQTTIYELPILRAEDNTPPLSS